eukprot:6190627-Pleurochrysis_carterae.AAC.3
MLMRDGSCSTYIYNYCGRPKGCSDPPMRVLKKAAKRGGPCVLGVSTFKLLGVLQATENCQAPTRCIYQPTRRCEALTHKANGSIDRKDGKISQLRVRSTMETSNVTLNRVAYSKI